MLPCRILLPVLALVGSLDFGASFANAKSVPIVSISNGATCTSTTLGATIPRAPCTTMPVRQRPATTSSPGALDTKMTALNVSAGGASADENSADFKKLSVFLTSLWGSGGVIYILAKAIKRVLPIALEPFKEEATPLSQLQLGIYIVTCLWFAYVEGYKGFQTKFSPLVVRRSLTLQPGTSGIHHILFAPFYSMGLFYATKKRQIVSWSVTIGVAAIVAAVKRLPYPWRNIIDAGVVAGLSWGSLSIILIYLKTWVTGQPPDMDAALPRSDGNINKYE